MSETRRVDEIRDHVFDAPPGAGAGDAFPCSQCGGALRFHPKRQNLCCPHCGDEVEIAPPSDPLRRAVAPIPYEAAIQEAEAAPAEVIDGVIACGGCGAVSTLEPGAHAAVCPFCATPFIGDPGRRRGLRPMGALPFALTEAEAKAALKSWLERLWFAPSDLTSGVREGDAFSGVYLPYWVFDADGEADYEGQRGDDYTKTVRVMGADGKSRTKRVTRTRWSRAVGRVRRAFADVLVAAWTQRKGAGAERALARRAPGGFDMHGLQPYQPAYLAGFRSEVYGAPLAEARQTAEGLMTQTLRRDARRDIGGDRQRIRRLDARFRDVQVKLVVAPIWIAAYRFGGRSYQIVVNGRTGAVAGQRPYSAWKIAIAAVLGLAAAALLALALFALEGR